MKKYDIDKLGIGDYVKIDLCDDWFKITGLNNGYVDLVDDCAMHYDCLPEDITDIASKYELKAGKYGFLKR